MILYMVKFFDLQRICVIIHLVIIFILLIRIKGGSLYNLLLIKGWEMPKSFFFDNVEVVATLNSIIIMLIITKPSRLYKEFF